MKILADASLPGLIEAFPKPFELSFYQNCAEVPQLLNNQDILLCRATLKVNQALLATHQIKCVATATSGIDHIDLSYLKKAGIQLFDAKGCNASAVADYVMATLAYLQKFKGFSGIKAGVIGVGEVGSRVVKRLESARMQVYCYDPLRKTNDTKFKSNSFEETIRQSDLLCLHANLHDTEPYSSKNLINEAIFQQLKANVVIVNAARGGIVDEEALVKQTKPISYCADVYNNEPTIDKKIIDFATLCTPHIAGHTVEAKQAAIAMLSQKLHQHYQFKIPVLTAAPFENDLVFPPNQDWQDRILTIYNPINETLALKAAENLASAFQKLRKAHTNRHDSDTYSR